MKLKRTLSSFTHGITLDAYDHAAVACGEVTDRTFLEMQKWCKQNECGMRSGRATFHFFDKQEATMFRLRWGS